MSITLILIIVVVAALLMGPVVMLVPKPGQRQREQLRLKARDAGLRFTLRKLPPLKTDMESPATMACYFVPPVKQKQPLQEWTIMRTAYSHEGNFYQEWDWVNNNFQPNASVKAFLQQQLPSLPDSVRAIDFGVAGVSVFWNEREGEALLDTLVALLKGIQAAASNQG